MMQLFGAIFYKNYFFILSVEKVLKKVSKKFFYTREVLYFCRMKTIMSHPGIFVHLGSSSRSAQFEVGSV